MRDVAGNEINKGSRVGFAIRKGNAVGLKIGTVEDDAVVTGSNRRGLAIKTSSGAMVLKSGHEVLVYQSGPDTRTNG